MSQKRLLTTLGLMFVGMLALSSAQAETIPVKVTPAIQKMIGDASKKLLGVGCRSSYEAEKDFIAGLSPKDGKSYHQNMLSNLKKNEAKTLSVLKKSSYTPGTQPRMGYALKTVGGYSFMMLELKAAKGGSTLYTYTCDY